MIALRARDVLFVWPLDRAAITAVARRGVSGIEALAEAGSTSAAAVMAHAVLGADAEDRAIAVEDARASLREQAVGRLMWLRVMAPAASGLGLAGAAVQAGWARHPEGLLALDPDRVLATAASAGATCVALGIAGSSTALGALFFLRRRALEALADADRVAQQAASAPASAWTGRAA